MISLWPDWGTGLAMFDETDLERFVEAQEESWTGAMSEIDAGLKQGHWIWYIYPQLRGLGFSHRAHYFGIADAEEARRYLAHPLLGARLLESCARLMPHAGESPERLLGDVDACKLQSCATLFAAVASDPAPFEAVLDAFFDGERCESTLEMLADGSA
ncbi:DUF1810 domain-containing protein [Tropicimonas sp. TH_r6]|uniref:DUF1810 domain-containing protein n=1 Tax=Tropicimonas sp. TH_r6 TaxID=3082085 RepID=UPI002953C4CD|nr:DUF1810 domain-containing protein [Tropicimonas sp. TH_r6]MDV7141205.1 DUF1810 domain-containing protein [Tropicimonas sp. TH_r6]